MTEMPLILTSLVPFFFTSLNILKAEIQLVKVHWAAITFWLDGGTESFSGSLRSTGAYRLTFTPGYNRWSVAVNVSE